MISSRVQIAVEIVALPSSIRVCAFPSHTSVPWDSPAIRTRSEKYFGFVSINICIAKSVPNSGIPRHPSLQPPISSGLITKCIRTLQTSDMTSLHHPEERHVALKSCKVLAAYGSLSDHRVQEYQVSDRLSINGMVVEMCRDDITVVMSFAGCCTGVKVSISSPTGRTMIPPGCWPVVLRIPVQPLTIRSISQYRLCMATFFVIILDITEMQFFLPGYRSYQL